MPVLAPVDWMHAEMMLVSWEERKQMKKSLKYVSSMYILLDNDTNIIMTMRDTR